MLPQRAQPRGRWKTRARRARRPSRRPPAAEQALLARACTGSAQWAQSLRASRCASTAETAAPVMNGSTPISFRRVSAPGASFVCSVESTRWPVSAASIEICAVSPSRISPTMTTSGSERRIERSAVANVRPARRLICTWLIPSSRYSTGSSTVMMLISGRLISASAAYSVVDLPEPVGPGDEQRSRRPRDDARQLRRASRRESPSSSSVGASRDLSSRRIVTASPSTVGSVATRMSSRRPAAAALREMRPSCGLRRSAMSSFASTFRRVVTPEASRFGIRCATCSTPSIRNRTTSASSCGSKWMSLAPSSAAWKMIELTSRTSGASEMPSSASRSSSSTCSAAASATASSIERGVQRLGRAREAAQLGQDVVLGGDVELDRVARREPELVEPLHVLRIGDRDLRSVSPSNANGIAHTRSSTAAGSPCSPRRRRRRPRGRRAAGGTARRGCGRRRASSRSPRRSAPARTSRRRAGCARSRACRAQADRLRRRPPRRARCDPASRERLVDRGVAAVGSPRVLVARRSSGQCSRSHDSGLAHQSAPGRRRGSRRRRRGRRGRRARGTARRESPSSAPPAVPRRAGPPRARARAIIATIIATGTVRPSMTPSSSASLTSPIPMPAGYASAATKRKPAAPSPARAHSATGAGAVCAASTTAAAGSTIRFGMIRRSRSVTETATSAAQKKRGDRGVPGQPEDEDASGDEHAGDELDERVLPRDRRAAVPAAAAQEQHRRASGMLSCHASGVSHAMQAEAGARPSGRSGTRAATTLRKLPSARPGTKANIASAAVTSAPAAVSEHDVVGQRETLARVPRRLVDDERDGHSAERRSGHPEGRRQGRERGARVDERRRRGRGQLAQPARRWPSRRHGRRPCRTPPGERSPADGDGVRASVAKVTLAAVPELSLPAASTAVTS